MRSLFCLGLAILLSSCTTTTTNYYSSTVEGWQGAQANGLVKTWGRPDIQVKGPQGNTAYIYKTETYSANQGMASPAVGVNFSADGKPIIVSQNNFNPSANRGLAITCTTVFLANNKGVITDTKVIGRSCYGNQGFAKRYGRSH